MKLNQSNLEAISQTAEVPGYDRSKVKCGIVHMSIGGFHRSHQAVYVDDVLANGATDWGICAVGMMPGDKGNIDKLQQQDNLYTVLERSAEADSARVIGSIIETLHAPSSPETLLARLASDDIKIVSLTITEKGYFTNNDKNLDQENEFIQHDLANLTAPKRPMAILFHRSKSEKITVRSLLRSCLVTTFRGTDT